MTAAGKIIHEGRIDKWIPRGPNAGYGFIVFFYAGSPSIDRVFYLWEDIESDNLGRRYGGTIERRAPVRTFRLSGVEA